MNEESFRPDIDRWAEEKDELEQKWHRLYLEVLKERDAARAQVEDLKRHSQGEIDRLRNVIREDGIRFDTLMDVLAKITDR